MLVLALLTEAEPNGDELVTRLQADGLGDIAAGTTELTRSTRAGRQLTMTVTATLGRTGAGPARDDAPTKTNQHEPVPDSKQSRRGTSGPS
jgi:hypothetical protein